MSKCPFANGIQVAELSASAPATAQDCPQVTLNDSRGSATEDTPMEALITESSSSVSPEPISTLASAITASEQQEESPEQEDQLMAEVDEEEEEEEEGEFVGESDDSDDDDDYDYVDDMLENFLDTTNSINNNAASASEPRGQKRKEPTSGNDEEEEEAGKNENEAGGSSGSLLERKRMVLIKRDQDHFEILPEGWVEITHFSGMPVYLHKASRVCTLSKPYLLGAGSARKHDVPVSSIPCLQYRKELEKEKAQQQQTEKISSVSVLQPGTSTNSNSSNPTSVVNGGSTAPPVADSIAGIAKVETLAENKKEKSVDFVLLREYCRKLFEFKLVTIRKFRTWADRRKHAQNKKLSQRPSLPESTKLITCTVPKGIAGGSPGKASKKEFIMNPAGKSVVCILHEFVQHTGRTQPKYLFKELDNSAKPYSATVVISNVKYGVGYGSSKKEAKTEAARESLRILIPGLQNQTEGEGGGSGSGGGQSTSDSNDLSFFDNIRIEDPRVSDLCMKAGQFTPYQILVECLRRHYGVKDMTIKADVRLLKHQRNEYKMKVGEHEAMVICKNKREGKQLAAQAILQKLHGHLNNWGALLKLYGRGSCKTPKEKREEAQQITELQSMACSNQPNYKILEKLREEMLKLRQRPAPSLPPTPINSIQLPATTNPSAGNDGTEGVEVSSSAGAAPPPSVTTLTSSTSTYTGISSLTSTLTLPS